MPMESSCPLQFQLYFFLHVLMQNVFTIATNTIDYTTMSSQKFETCHIKTPSNYFINIKYIISIWTIELVHDTYIQLHVYSVGNVGQVKFANYFSLLQDDNSLGHLLPFCLFIAGLPDTFLIARSIYQLECPLFSPVLGQSILNDVRTLKLRKLQQLLLNYVMLFSYIWPGGIFPPPLQTLPAA